MIFEQENSASPSHQALGQQDHTMPPYALVIFHQQLKQYELHLNEVLYGTHALAIAGRSHMQ